MRLFAGGYPTLSGYWRSQIDCPLRGDLNTGEESARIRVYNTLFRVPYHLERFIWIGVMACLDTILVRRSFINILSSVFVACQLRRS